VTATADTTLSVRSFRDDLREVEAFLSYLPRGPWLPTLYTTPYLKWKIAGNPFGHSAAYLRYRDGQPAAHCSIVAKPPAIGGMALAELGDTHTHPDFQRQGHFSAIGRHVIEDFTRQHSPQTALIYGLPNENALPGWTRNCGCEVMVGLGVREVRRGGWQHPASWTERFRRSEHTLHRLGLMDTTVAVDVVWWRTDGIRWLVEKHSGWWRWRYNECPERYETFVMRGEGGAPMAWVVLKRARAGLSPMRRVTICDVVARTEALEAEAFRLALVELTTPFDVVRTWVQDGTPLAYQAQRLGFTHMRHVPVIFALNEAYETLKCTVGKVRLSGGDTDNV
jgi:hypothetical protein